MNKIIKNIIFMVFASISFYSIFTPLYIEKVEEESRIKNHQTGIILEFTPEGEIVYQNKNIHSPAFYKRISNDEIILAEGNTSNIYFFKNRVLKYLYRLNFTTIYSIEKTFDNHNLITVNSAKPVKILELDKEGKSLWQCEKYQHPIYTKKLSNNNYLIVDKHKKIIDIIDKEFNVIQSFPLPNDNHKIYHFKMINDNHFKLYYPKKVIEIDNKGNILSNTSINNPYKGIHANSIIQLNKDNYAIISFHIKTIIFSNGNGELLQKYNNIQIKNYWLSDNGNISIIGNITD